MPHEASYSDAATDHLPIRKALRPVVRVGNGKSLYLSGKPEAPSKPCSHCIVSAFVHPNRAQKATACTNNPEGQSAWELTRPLQCMPPPPSHRDSRCFILFATEWFPSSFVRTLTNDALIVNRSRICRLQGTGENCDFHHFQFLCRPSRSELWRFTMTEGATRPSQLADL